MYLWFIVTCYLICFSRIKVSISNYWHKYLKCAKLACLICYVLVASSTGFQVGKGADAEKVTKGWDLLDLSKFSSPGFPWNIGTTLQVGILFWDGNQHSLKLRCKHWVIFYYQCSHSQGALTSTNSSSGRRLDCHLWGPCALYMFHILQISELVYLHINVFIPCYNEYF